MKMNFESLAAGGREKEARNYEAIGLNGKIAIDIVCDLMARTGDEEEYRSREVRMAVYSDAMRVFSDDPRRS